MKDPGNLRLDCATVRTPVLAYTARCLHLTLFCAISLLSRDIDRGMRVSGDTVPVPTGQRKKKIIRYERNATVADVATTGTNQIGNVRAVPFEISVKSNFTVRSTPTDDLRKTDRHSYTLQVRLCLLELTGSSF